MKLNLNIDPREIAEQLGTIKQSAIRVVQQSVKALAASTNAKAQELASQQLSSTSKTFRDALSFQEVADNIWVVSLDEKMLWREDGRNSGDMTQDLLKNNSRISKDGTRYKAIPFDYGKKASEVAMSATSYVQQVKSFLRKQKVSYRKIELDDKGSPRIGRLHSFNIPSELPSKRASTPVLYGLSIYQTKDAKTGKVRRDVLTFRTVSDKHRGNKWIHPGLEGVKILDQAFDWAVQTWESQILPDLLNKL